MNKEIKGYAIIDQDNMIMYNDFDFTEKEFRQWYRNKLENNPAWKVVEISLRDIKLCT